MKLTINQKIQQLNLLIKEGKFIEVENLSKEILKTQPKNPSINHTLGIAQQKIGKLKEAEINYKKAIELKPDYFECYYNMGFLFGIINRFDEAKHSFKKAISIKTDFFQAYSSLGGIQYRVGKLKEAETSYKKAIALKPDYAEAYMNLGSTYHKLNKFLEAEMSYKKAIELKPDYAEAYMNLGSTYHKLNKFLEAEMNYKKAIELKPDYAEAYMSLGLNNHKIHKFLEAETSYKKAIELKPDYAKAHCNLGNLQDSQKKFIESLVSYDRAYALDPEIDFLLGSLQHTKMHLCMWDDFSINIDDLTKKINRGGKTVTPLTLLALIDDPKIHRKAAETFSNNRVPKSNFFPKISHYYEHKKIRLGYFSGDFRNHPVAFLTAELYELHDRTKFEIHAFSFGPDENDKFNMRIKKNVDHFHDVRMMSNDDVVKLSRSLEIDIAIDLTGFTTEARVDIFTMLAAPTQVNYLGYAGTMSMNSMDYLIADHTLIPKESKKFYSEKIVYMTNSYQVNISKTDVSKITFLRHEVGLPETSFIFCCFNNHYKITPSIFASWMRILKATNDSILWLLVEDVNAKKNLKQQAIKFGIDEERLIFAKKLPHAENLKRIQTAGLFLDTFPYNAHTTASDALRMGLPVLTCMGQSFASRVAASLLKAVNLSELITVTQDEYETLAIDLATHPKKLKTIKEKLANNLPTSPLYDSKLFTGHLEAAYLTMHNRCRKKLNPDDIEIEL